MRLALSCLVAMLVASPALAFEGVMEASLSSDQGIAARVQARYSKEGDVRMDIQSVDANGAPARATTLMPSQGESYFSIDHGQKVIVEMPYSTLAAASQQVKGSGESANLQILHCSREDL